MAIDDILVERVSDRLVPLEGVTEKKLFGCACFLLQGNVVAGVWRQWLVVRVGREEYEYALQDRHANPFDITGKPLRGWVRVEPEGVERDEKLGDWIGRAVTFVSTLPAA